MFRKGLAAGIWLAMMSLVSTANAVTLKISATSATAGNLGYFLVDDAVLAKDASLVASQFVGYYFSDHNTKITFTPGNVDGNTGVTHFGLMGSVWTVIGGGGDSLTDVDLGNGLWIAGVSFVSFKHGGFPSYGNVTWGTEAYLNPVPLPGALVLFGTGFGIMSLVSWWRRRRTVEAIA